MIHYLKIRNFGPIKDEVEISFEVADGIEKDAYEIEMHDGRRLLKLAYIYGANASGKTTILNAFAFLKKLLLEPLTTKDEELDFDPFLFCEAPLDINSFFELSFYSNSIRYVYEVTFNKQAIIQEKLNFYRRPKPALLFSRETDMEKLLTKIQFGSTIKAPAREKDLLESNTLHNNSVLGAFTKTNVDINELFKLKKWANDTFANDAKFGINAANSNAIRINTDKKFKVWMNDFMNRADSQILSIHVPNLQNKAKKILNANSILPTLALSLKMSLSKMAKDLRNTIIDNSEIEIDFIHQTSQGRQYKLSLQKESSGTQKYFNLGGELYDLIYGNHFKWIDELESSLHPDLMKYFLQMFLLNSNGSQLLITTHNFSLMADTDFIRWDALWFSEKSVDGEVTLYSAADFDTSTLRKDASLINAYKAGRLGAKPNLGSTYLPNNP